MFINIKGFHTVRNLTFNKENLDIPIIKQVMGVKSEMLMILEIGYLVKVRNKMVTFFNVTHKGSLKNL